MCGRFTQHYTWSEVYAFLNVLGAPRNLQPHYNIAPADKIDVVRLNREGARELVSMRWWLVPFFWSKSLKEVPATFNARVETVAEKPMFREAFKKRRCIIPASGFYEWTGDKKDRQPHLFTAADGSSLLAFAGLWDQWKDRATGETILSCTMIVSGASEWMTDYHDRMPVLLDAKDFDAWLDGSMGSDHLKPAAESALRQWTVSKRMNKTGAGGPTIQRPSMPRLLSNGRSAPEQVIANIIAGSQKADLERSPFGSGCRRPSLVALFLHSCGKSFRGCPSCDSQPTLPIILSPRAGKLERIDDSWALLGRFPKCLANARCKSTGRSGFNRSGRPGEHNDLR